MNKSQTDFTPQMQADCYKAGTKCKSIHEVLAVHNGNRITTIVLHHSICSDGILCKEGTRIRQMIAKCAYYFLLGYRDAKRYDKK